MSFKIAFLPGDGVGPEVSYGARLVLEAVASRFDISLDIGEYDFGGIAIDKTGTPLPAATLDRCLLADAVFLGAVGGPKWDGANVRPESGLLTLRKSMGVFANLRPVQSFNRLDYLSPLSSDRAKDINFIIVRELTGGIYFGDRQEGDDYATDMCAYSREEVERVARIAFDIAGKRKKKLVSVDKANVLATSRLWRKVVNELQCSTYPDISVEHILVDAMAMKLIQNPAAYDVILTENMFGDILSDEASVITGSIGLAPSASLGAGVAGLYEPIHGSAPDIAGQDKANPIGAILSIAMMLRYSLQNNRAALSIENAVLKVFDNGDLTPDLGGKKGLRDVAVLVTQFLN